VTDFPTIVYRTPGPFKKPRGGAYAIRPAADKEAFDALIAKGWSASYEEAISEKRADAIIEKAEAFEDAIDEVSDATRDELEAKAKELKVSFNARTSDKKLAERIAEKLED
jgi:hypothetical protein